jgi:DNA repair exonuclease SbcCD ATPase subunit
VVSVRVRSFQIIGDAAIDVDGITMVVGSTNHGKSSLCRAIESALFSNQGSDFIHYDAEKCQVDIVFPQGDDGEKLSVSWIKGRTGGSEYVINKKEFKRTGKTAPEDLEKAGIKDIVVRDNKERLFIWRQMEEPFLVFSSPSYIFDFVSQLMQDKKLTPVLKQMVVDSKQIKTELVALEGQVAAYQNSLLQLKNKEAVLAQITAAEPDFLSLRKGKVKYERLVAIKQGYEAVVPQLEQVSGAVTLLDNEVILPLLSFSNVPSQVGNYQKLMEALSVISKLDSELIATDNAVKGREAIISSIQIPDRSLLDKEEKLRDFAQRFFDVGSQLFQCGEAQKSLAFLIEQANPPEKSLVDRFKGLSEMGGLFSALLGSMSGVSGEIEEEQKRLTEAEADFEKYKDEIGVCPLCQEPLDSHKGGVHGK